MYKLTTKIILITTLGLVLATMCGAQSTDMESPTPLSSNVLTIAGPKKVNQQFYYSLSAGPGEVTMTFDVRAKAYSTFVGVKVFDSEMNTLTYHNMSAATGSPGIAKKTFEVSEKQTIVVSFTSDPSLANCKITFGGAVELAAGMNGSGGPIVSEASPPTATEISPQVLSETSVQPTEEAASGSGGGSKNKSFTMSILDAVGQRFNIPANGKLKIEMKDGSVQEIDLGQVKKIVVKK
jgi:hypothetical protein